MDHPALKQAIIAVKPDYFSLPEREQEYYRATMPAADRFRLDQRLLAALFHIQVDSKEALNAAFDAFDDAQYLLYNRMVLAITGIGEDCFYLNECLPEGKTLLDYETLYDYDEADHRYQEAARAREFKGYQAQPYYGSLYLNWARLLIDGAFTYAHLSMVSGYVYSQLDTLGFDQIDRLIPHRYVPGPQHGKREGKGTLWDRRIDAHGKEAQLDELKERYWRYTEARRRALAEQLDSLAQPRVYVVPEEEDDDPLMHFVFTDKSALKAVRFRHFMSDCRAILGDQQALERRLDQEMKDATAFLEQNCQDILENFDPTVVKFKKKHKILLSDQALKDLF